MPIQKEKHSKLGESPPADLSRGFPAPSCHSAALHGLHHATQQVRGQGLKVLEDAPDR